MAETAQGETPTPNAEAEKADAQDTTKADAAELAAQLAEVKKALRDANRESADRRKKLEAFEQAEAERKTAEMTEAQKLQAKLEALQAEKDAAIARANTALVKAQVMARAAGQFYDAEDVYLALRDKLQVTDDGAVEGLEDAIKELIKVKPHWVKKPGAGLAATAPGQNGSGSGETPAERRKRLLG